MPEKVTFSGLFLEREELKTIGRDSFVSKCLCTTHNNLLSPCDAEVKRFREVMEWWGNGRQPNDPPSVIKHIDGFLLAKWFAKTACNMAAVEKKHVPRPLIRYAFSSFDDPFIHVYFLPGPDDVLEINRAKQETHWFRDRKNEDCVAVVFYYWGLPFLISTFDVAGLEAKVCELFQIQTTKPGSPFVDRLGAIKIGSGPDKRGAIWFDWPDVERGVDVDVEIFAMCRAATADGGTINLLGTFDVILGDSLPLTKRGCAFAALLRFGRDEVGSHEIRLSLEDESGEHRNGETLIRTIDASFQKHSDLPSFKYPFIADNIEIGFQEFGDYKMALFVDGKKVASRPIFVRKNKNTS